LQESSYNVSRYSDLAGTTLVGSTSYTYDAGQRLTRLEHRNGSGNLLANYTSTLRWTPLSRPKKCLSYSPGELRSPTSSPLGPVPGHSFPPRRPFTGAEGLRGGKKGCPRPTTHPAFRRPSW
jgi:hypothetical protein